MGLGTGTVFFFPWKSSFYTHFWKKSIERMKKLFFFPATEKKNNLKIDWMNGTWTFFSVKKKIQPKTKKMGCIFFSVFLEKKKHIFWIWMNEWAMNFFAEIKKYGTFAGTHSFYNCFLFKKTKGEILDKITGKTPVPEQQFWRKVTLDFRQNFMKTPLYQSDNL